MDWYVVLNILFCNVEFGALRYKLGLILLSYVWDESDLGWGENTPKSAGFQWHPYALYLRNWHYRSFLPVKKLVVSDCTVLVDEDLMSFFIDHFTGSVFILTS